MSNKHNMIDEIISLVMENGERGMRNERLCC